MSFLDELDRRIIQELVKDSTLSTRALGAILGESSSTLYNRIRRLVEKGVIMRYSIVLDYEQLGFSVSSFIQVEVEERGDRDLTVVAEEIAALEGVKELYVLTGGEYQLLIKARGKSIHEIGTLVMEKIRKVEGVVRTNVSTVYKKVLGENEKIEELL